MADHKGYRGVTFLRQLELQRERLALLRIGLRRVLLNTVKMVDHLFENEGSLVK